MSRIRLWQWNYICTSGTRVVVPYEDEAIFLVQQQLGNEFGKFGELGLTVVLLE
jgi:hypothetical protein